MFLENKGLFSNTNLGAVLSLRNMEADFGILPIPKYDEEQGKVARDEGAADMIDILFSTRCYDWGEFLAIGGFPDKFVYLTLKDNKNVSTLYAQYESKMLSDLEKINSLFGE